ncbi:MAG: Txe/YoeB family addiction module toxin [Proteobacteria bacterium]|nr:Txe/YoeB family addiction module toxin [Pseudomonadota bacterium]
MNKYQIKYTKNAAEDISFFKERDQVIYRRIKLLLEDILGNPFTGMGKPEMLRYSLNGKWSRRITSEHRLVYELIEDQIIIHQCRFHYKK